MKSRDFATVSFVVVGLLYFAYGISLLQMPIAFLDSSGLVQSLAMFVPTVLLFYLGFYIIRVRDRLAEQLLPDEEGEGTSRLSKRELMTVAFSSIGLFLCGLGFPGLIKVLVQVIRIFQAAPEPSVLVPDSGMDPQELFRILPEATRVGSQFLIGLILVWVSPKLADRLSGTRND